MGKEIVRQESPEDPGKRSRLWASGDIIQVLEENTGTSKITIICPNSRIDVEWDGEAFKKMENLRTLIIMDGQFTESPKHLPNSLRILIHCLNPSWGLPSQFYPRKLAICEIPSYSTLFEWGDFFKQKFKNMRVLNFDHHGLLTQIPDVSGLVNLEEFSFQGCVNLITVHDSVGLLGKLKTLRGMGCIKLRSIPPLKLDSLEKLDLSYCYNLDSFPIVVDGLLDKLKFSSIKHCVMLWSIPPLRLTSLKLFNLSYCLSLESFPEILGEMRNVPNLNLEYTPIKELPFPFQNLTLPKTHPCNCGIFSLPTSNAAVSKVVECTIQVEQKVIPIQSSLVEFICLRNWNVSDEYLSIGLMLFANVKELHLNESQFTFLPKSLEKCHFLWRLVLDNCKELQEIKGIPPCLKSLSAFNCKSLSSSCKSKLLSQMDSSDDSDFNFDEDGDNGYSTSSEDDESIESRDHDVSGDYNENLDSCVIDGRFVKINTMTADDIMNLDFGSEEEAYAFYQKYAKSTGFVVRKDKVYRSKVGKQIVMRQFVCNKNGLRSKKHLTRVNRKREHRPLTRNNCPARLRIRYNPESLRWRVVIFEGCHNHELTPSKYIHLFPAYRGLTDADKAQVDSMQSYGIKTCHIMGYMVANKGGYDAVGFTKKDLYNYFGKKMGIDIKDGDVVASLSYLRGKAGLDPMLYVKYEKGTNGKLKRLFWADGWSRNDFLCYGDVIAFDTTYKKNKYNLPLVIFSGCNNHSQTIIFGAALVLDETIETYTWVLNSFLEAMGNRQPKAVVTDGDMSMRDAVKVVFPEAFHRLCAWHLHKNAYENVKNKEFLTNFKKAMYSDFTPEEFEEFWASAVEMSELQGNNWVSKTYENKKLWATAYFRDKFFGRIRTTSQCEAINSVVKKYVRKKCSIYEFLHNFDHTLREYRNNEHVADFKSNTSDPVLITGLDNIEKDASKIYTSEIFKKVRKHIVKSSALIVHDQLDVEDKSMFKLSKTCNEKYRKEVVYDTADSSFHCECRLFESRGFPCSHIIFVMKVVHIDHIPSSLILKRWTKNAKIPIMGTSHGNGMDSNMIELARCGAYSAACDRFCKVAAESGACFNDVMDDILELTEKYSKLKLGGAVKTQNSEGNRHIGDPDVIRSKGAPKKKTFSMKRFRHCSNCTGANHNVRTCPKRNGVDGSQIDSDEESESDATKFSNAADNIDKEMSKGDLNNIHGSVRSRLTEHGRQIDKNVKGRSNSNPKQKKTKELNAVNHPIGKQIDKGESNSNLKKKKKKKSKEFNEIRHPDESQAIMSQVQPNIHQMHHPMPPFVNSSQRLPPTNGQTPPILQQPQQNEINHPIASQPMMSTVQPNVHQMHYPMHPFANSSQVLPSMYSINGQTPLILQQPPHNETNHLGSQPMMSQVRPNVHQMHYPMYHLANSSQVLPPIHSINGQTTPILQQPPHYFFGMPRTTNGSSCTDMLQQVMNKGR